MFEFTIKGKRAWIERLTDEEGREVFEGTVVGFPSFEVYAGKGFHEDESLTQLISAMREMVDACEG